MADILIKGLEDLKIPKEKRLVLAIEPDGEVWFPFEYKISRTFPVSASGAKTTTAIELPSVGRWIDGQELKAFLERKMCDVRCAEGKMNCDNCVISTLFKVIDKSPTLVCEEGENPDGTDN